MTSRVGSSLGKQLLLVLGLACTALCAGYKESPYLPMVRELRADAIEVLTKRHDMACVGCGGAMMDGVHEIELIFQIERPLSREEIRRILVDAVEEVRERVNNHEGLRPYLDSWPVGYELAHVSLWIADEKGNEVYAPLINQGYSGNGRVVYWQQEPGKEWSRHPRSEEPYEEALKIVRGEK